MFSYSTSRSSPPEVFYKKAVLKISAIFTGKNLHWNPFLIKLQGLQHRWKATPTEVTSCEYCGIFKNSVFIDNFWWLLLNVFTESQKEKVFSINRSVMKTFKCSFPVDLICQYDAQNVQHSQKQYFIAWISLLSWYIDIFCFFICQKLKII